MIHFLICFSPKLSQAKIDNVLNFSCFVFTDEMFGDFEDLETGEVHSGKISDDDEEDKSDNDGAEDDDKDDSKCC